MQNNSGLRPLGRAVLIAPYVPEQKESIIILTEDTQTRDQMVEQRAVVIEVGPTAWSDEPLPRAKPGDKVIVARYAGYLAKGTKDGAQYRFVNDKDIFAAITDEG